MKRHLLAPAALLFLSLRVMTAAMGAAAPAGEAGGGADTEPLPVSVRAEPALAVLGTPVHLRGTSAPALGDAAATLTVRQTSEAGRNLPTPHTVATLSASIEADGSYEVTFNPRAAGAYTVQAVAPDGKGRAGATFTVEDATALSPETAAAIETVVADVVAITDAVQQKLNSVPPSPARDEANRRIADLRQQVRQLQQPTQEFSGAVGRLLHYVYGPAVPVEVRIADGQQLFDTFARARNSHQRSQEEERRIAQTQVVCDNLEVVTEGIKWVGVLLNFAGNASTIAVNFAKGIDAAAAQKFSHASDNRKFLGGEIIKNLDTLTLETTKTASRVKVSAGNIVSTLNDLVGFGVDKLMASYCVQFVGPVTAHMQAQFFENGAKWWEYGFGLQGQITLHYPKGASGGSVPLKGHLEGVANNFTVWEDGLTVMYPSLMSSTVKKKLVIPPTALPIDAATARDVYVTEGSVFGQGLPNSFFFEVHGTATENSLQIQVGPARSDMDASARVIVIYLPVLSLMPGLATYSLPYKPAHFLFERAADSYTVPLTTQGKVMRGRQHFHNSRGAGGPARGDYSVDIEVCNPAC